MSCHAYVLIQRNTVVTISIYKFTGNVQLLVILCLASDESGQLENIPSDMVELIKSYQLSTFITKVGHPLIRTLRSHFFFLI